MLQTERFSSLKITLAGGRHGRKACVWYVINNKTQDSGLDHPWILGIVTKNMRYQGTQGPGAYVFNNDSHGMRR